MMNHAIIFMTAIVPTQGHKILIDFADSFMRMKYKDNYIIHVIISTRSKEPTSFHDRRAGFGKYTNVFFIEHFDDYAPQNPTSESDYKFWHYWKSVASKFVGDDISYIFASEKYGVQMAEVLGAEYIPCDIDRTNFPVKGSDVRANMLDNQHLMLPEFIHKIQNKFVFFGQESVGKTTNSRYFAQFYNGQFVNEYARGYLETVGAELSPAKMNNIIMGQYIQDTKKYDKLFVFQDTDLVTTYGYHKLFCEQYNQKEYLEGLKHCEALILDNIKHYKDNFYIVLPDDVPFEQDILRYGGDKRETTMQFWVDILKQFGLRYWVLGNVPRSYINELVWYIVGSNVKDIQNFKRD